jgi:hypothetical protein
MKAFKRVAYAYGIVWMALGGVAALLDKPTALVLIFGLIGGFCIGFGSEHE